MSISISISRQTRNVCLKQKTRRNKKTPSRNEISLWHRFTSLSLTISSFESMISSFSSKWIATGLLLPSCFSLSSSSHAVEPVKILAVLFCAGGMFFREIPLLPLLSMKLLLAYRYLNVSYCLELPLLIVSSFPSLIFLGVFLPVFFLSLPPTEVTRLVKTLMEDTSKWKAVQLTVIVDWLPPLLLLHLQTVFLFSLENTGMRGVRSVFPFVSGNSLSPSVIERLGLCLVFQLYLCREPLIEWTYQSILSSYVSLFLFFVSRLDVLFLVLFHHHVLVVEEMKGGSEERECTRIVGGDSGKIFTLLPVMSPMSSSNNDDVTSRSKEQREGEK